MWLWFKECWLLCARDGCSSLGEAKQLKVRIYDRDVRRMLSDRITRFLQALFHDGAGASGPVILEDLPDCRVASQRSGCVLGVIATMIQEHAGQVSLDRASPTFVSDIFLVLRLCLRDCVLKLVHEH